MLYFWGNQTFF
ncbi:hypothetical protein SPV_2511 [Streptococcus pneumoniae]|nr:hypothetical protein SPV_2511 [Streptococcus pneumoniae]